MWILIAVSIIAGVLLATMQPSPPNSSVQKGTVPDVKDGKRLVRVYGTVWLDDPSQFAMKEVGEIPIKK